MNIIWFQSMWFESYRVLGYGVRSFSESWVWDLKVRGFLGMDFEGYKVRGYKSSEVIGFCGMGFEGYMILG